MDQSLFRQFTSFVEEKWIKRVRVLTNFISRISKIRDVMVQPQVINVISSSKGIKNFLDILDDVSTFNITKMNQSGLLVKSINSSKKLTNFLTKNSSSVESVFRYIVKLDDYFPNSSNFLKNASKYIKATGIVLGVIDFGHKTYKNYRTTKSVPKSFIGATIDSVKDFNLIDGITYGSYLGVKGAVAGAVVGGVIQVVNFFNPNYFDDVKKWAFKKYDDLFNKKAESKEDEFRVSKEVIYERIQFYTILVTKIDAMILVLKRFSNQFDELASGKTATVITKIGIERLINKCKSLLDNYINPTLEELRRFQQEIGKIFYYDSILNGHTKNHVIVNSSEVKLIKKNLSDSVEWCNCLLYDFKHLSHEFDILNAINSIHKFRIDLLDKKQALDHLLNHTSYLEGLRIYE